MKAEIILGDVRDSLKKIPDGSVQTVVTSPPYWGLRDYGNDGQLGLESTPQKYVDNMVEVFREVKRVLRDDGTLWLNIGDSYSGSGKGPAGNLGKTHDERNMEKIHSAIVPDGLKPKDLVGIPWRVAFALQADGWYLRQDIIWAKPNPMPESVKDRCTKSHEYLFLLTKSPKYYFDSEAIKENGVIPAGTKGAKGSVERQSQKGVNARPPIYKIYDGKRNKRDVWSVTTKPFKGAHHAVMPEALVEPCILAGTPQGGCCSTCRTPYMRDFIKGERVQREVREETLGVIPGREKTSRLQSKAMEAVPKEFVGWIQNCKCENSESASPLVLDPFTGSGTVAVVALRQGCDFIGTELNPEYAEIAKNRISESNPLFNEVEILL